MSRKRTVTPNTSVKEKDVELGIENQEILEVEETVEEVVETPVEVQEEVVVPPVVEVKPKVKTTLITSAPVALKENPRLAEFTKMLEEYKVLRSNPAISDSGRVKIANLFSKIARYLFSYAKENAPILDAFYNYCVENRGGIMHPAKAIISTGLSKDRALQMECLYSLFHDMVQHKINGATFSKGRVAAARQMFGTNAVIEFIDRKLKS